MRLSIRPGLLLPGDVVLCEGTSAFSRMIQFFDGSDFSHAALYLGDGEIGESVPPNVRRHQLAETIDHCPQVQALRLKEAPADMSPVVRKCLSIVELGSRYSYEQCVLLAFLCLTRKLKVNPILQHILRKVLDRAAALMIQFAEQGSQLMICSELVYRSFDEAVAGPDNPFSLEVGFKRLPLTESVAALSAEPTAAPPPALGQGVHPHSLLAFVASEASDLWIPATPRGSTHAAVLADLAPPADDDAELEELFDRYLEQLQQPPAAATAAAEPGVSIVDLRSAVDRFAVSFHQASQSEPAAALAERSFGGIRSVAFDELFKTAADFVTPGDLLRSPSLYQLGILEKPPAE